MADFKSMLQRMLLFIRLGVLALLLILILACDLIAKTSVKPSVAILSPQNGSQFQEGQDVVIQSVSSDGQATRVELQVDDKIARVDPVGAGQSNLSQTWKAIPGTHKVSVRVFNASDVASDPAFIAIVVAPSVALANTPTVALPGAAVSPNAVATPIPPQPRPSPTL